MGGKRACAILALLPFAYFCAVDVASAACDKATKRNLRAAKAISQSLTVSNAPGAADAAAVVGRARKHCRPGHARFALAVAKATKRFGVAQSGVTRTIVGVPLIGIGSTYRLNTYTVLNHWYAKRGRLSADAALVAATQLAHASGGVILWSYDPTVGDFSFVTQSRIASMLAAGKSARAKSTAGATAAAFRSPSRVRTLLSAPLLSAVTASIHLSSAARAVGARDARKIASIEKRIRKRIRLSDTGSWAKVDGVYASVVQQRSLAKLARRLSTVAHDPVLAVVARHLKAELTTKPTVLYKSVPMGSFYPWPHDGVLDYAAVSVFVNKPATVVLTIFNDNGTAVTNQTATVYPGIWIGSWAGNTAAGAAVLASPGNYRYGLHVTDWAGNQTVVPGLGTFNLARDTTAPTINSVTLKYLSGITRRKIRVRWSVTEPISPKIKVVLSFRQNGVRRNVTVPTSALSGTTTIAVALPKGTHRVFAIVSDGSGNTATARAKDITF